MTIIHMGWAPHRNRLMHVRGVRGILSTAKGVILTPSFFTCGKTRVDMLVGMRERMPSKSCFGCEIWTDVLTVGAQNFLRICRTRTVGSPTPRKERR